uniref:Serine/threonine-protein phosphatase 4 regulatory subunit 1 n=1 Tax=Latimeria chalumnae TaxID=7897 RepID=H3ACD5_LATCH|nr:PREDICTED: serine/threonine-protein phosphatase 4 regulatory subunit 1-like [Latimeria chalumnae]|eukprot:XP_005993612.1 PREDICTED: serine/threonine-protein phosphatase 4 regulatory subunit 1-like [Latimeria chalumnae]
MAGVPLYFEGSHDDFDDFGFEDYGPDCDMMRITAFLDVANQDNLTPLEQLEKYAFSENVLNRQIVARGLLDVLRAFSENENDFLTVMEVVARLSEDSEATVRAELMEQIPHIALFLQDGKINFPNAFSKYFVPIVVRYLTDPNNQVRKTSQAALLVLLEQDLIDQRNVETKVCPILLALTGPESDDDQKIEAVAIICKMCSMLNKDLVESVLLSRFCELCSEGRLFQVRKVCAANFGDICTTVGQETTEHFLIPKFFELCSDSVWGIRKACAECFMSVSYSTSPETRRTKLSPLFISLISDSSRWVRQAAFQSLGLFISTFANPSSASLYFKEDGTLSIRLLNEDLSLTSGSCTNPTDSSNSASTSENPAVEMTLVESPEVKIAATTEISQDSANGLVGSCDSTVEGLSSASGKSSASGDTKNNPTASVADENICTKDFQNNNLCSKAENPNSQIGSNEDIFNSFHYWRSPLPDISLDLDLLQLNGTEQEKSSSPCSGVLCISHATSNDLEKMLESLQAHMDDPDVQAQVQVLSAALKAAQLDSQSEEEPSDSDETQPLESKTIVCTTNDQGTTLVTEEHVNSNGPLDIGGFQFSNEENQLNRSKTSLSNEQDVDLLFEDDKSKLQDIIPQPLLEQYLSMTDPARAQTVDTEIAKHCAYSLPGVALTLGRQNWHCLKDTYETLASDVQWKVRRTLAFSIHELAVILGDQLTAADLVPIFNGFLKDLDEVRIGVLKHLYDFLKLLHTEKRREYLYQLQEFMVTDNSRNWRFRYELAEQLILLLDLYSPNDIYDYLRHIGLTLCSDKVSEVRWISYKLIVAILRKFYKSGANELGLNFINELTVRFRHSPKWVGRQAFAFICQAVVEEECLPCEQFVEHLLPSLLSLVSDPVANVRVLLAKALKQTLLQKAYFTDIGSLHVEAVQETLLVLQSDRDQDVQFFATAEPKRNTEDVAAFVN